MYDLVVTTIVQRRVDAEINKKIWLVGNYSVYTGYAPRLNVGWSIN